VNERVVYSLFGSRHVRGFGLDNDRIELEIEGLSENDGRVSLRSLTSQIQSFGSILNKIDRDESGGKSETTYEVVTLSFASPYRLAVKPKALGLYQPAGLKVISSLKSLIHDIVSEKRLDHVNPDVLEAIKSFAKNIGKQIKNVKLIVSDAEIEFNESIVSRIDKALSNDLECEGFVEGRLEQINLHGGANTFYIYPEVGPKRVACHFDERLTNEAVAAVGRRVEVVGTLRYKLGAKFSHEIIVSSIDVHPSVEDLPDWEDIRGRAPDCIGELRSEAYIREQRNAWT
jgi:hypothetical protein